MVKKKSSYKPTGYPRGRPQSGTFRPLTEKMIKRRAWYYDNLERERERSREANEKFRADHPERAREIERNSRIRRKGWLRAKDVSYVPTPVTIAIPL